MTYIEIDGVEMPAPSNYTIKRTDFDGDEGGISEAGYEKRDRVREGVYEIPCDWVLYEPQLQFLYKALSKESFVAKVYDGTTGDYVTINAKASTERTATLTLPNSNRNRNLWSFSCSIVEF